MKAWSDLPDPKPRGRPLRIPSGEPGYTRLDRHVADVDRALLGEEFRFSVLEDPSTGAWYGEDPSYPGSGLVHLDREAVLDASSELVDALDQVVAFARPLRTTLEARAADQYRGEVVDRARTIAAGLARPALDDVVLDLGRSVADGDLEPAQWRREDGRVRLETLRSDDDPLFWTHDWTTSEDLLVVDDLDGRAAVERLRREVAAGEPERPAWIDDRVRQEALGVLRSVDLGLWQRWVDTGQRER
jgi:hypothetical protein